MDGDLTLLGFGPEGWGLVLLRAAGTTVAVSASAFALGAVLGGLCAWARLSGPAPVRWLAQGYTTVLRGVPDLLVIYLFYFGGRQALSLASSLLGGPAGLDFNGFLAGMLAIGLISGAGQSEVMRGAYLALSRGELEAARVVGMGRWLMLRRIVVPQGLRLALPGLGNQWQSAVKESALVSVTGLVETLRQVSIAANSTELPLFFFLVGGAIYLLITSLSGLLLRGAEAWSMRGQPAIGARG